MVTIYQCSNADQLDLLNANDIKIKIEEESKGGEECKVFKSSDKAFYIRCR
jgi:hypothetical protein